MPLEISLVGVLEIDNIWPLIVRDMQHACDRSEQDEPKLTAGDLWQMCRSGNAFLIIIYKPETFDIQMASVWRFERRTAAFRCLMMFGTGMNRWFSEALKFVTAMAKENGATRLVSEGRRGWQRYFEPSDDYDLELKI